MEHPDIYEQFTKSRIFVIKTKPGSFNSVALDMKLEQSIQRSKKGFGGIIGQAKQATFVLEWELMYHEILAIVNGYSEINNIKGHSDSNKDYNSKNHYELSGGYGRLFNALVKKVSDFIKSKVNPFNHSSRLICLT